VRGKEGTLPSEGKKGQNKLKYEATITTAHEKKGGKYKWTKKTSRHDTLDSWGPGYAKKPKNSHPYRREELWKCCTTNCSAEGLPQKNNQGGEEDTNKILDKRHGGMRTGIHV